MYCLVALLVPEKKYDWNKHTIPMHIYSRRNADDLAQKYLDNHKNGSKPLIELKIVKQENNQETIIHTYFKKH
jgi:hypothetical protein